MSIKDANFEKFKFENQVLRWQQQIFDNNFGFGIDLILDVEFLTVFVVAWKQDIVRSNVFFELKFFDSILFFFLSQFMITLLILIFFQNIQTNSIFISFYHRQLVITIFVKVTTKTSWIQELIQVTIIDNKIRCTLRISACVQLFKMIRRTTLPISD